VPSQPLRRAFAGTPFLSLLGRTPLIVWFSRVSEGCYRDDTGSGHAIGGPEQTLYNEVTILAGLRKRALFSPVIYASNPLSIPIATRYGMPKHVGSVSFEMSEGNLNSALRVAGGGGTVSAQVIRGGRWLALILSRLWPVWTWPVAFPSGRSIQALVQATPKVQLARVRRGSLALSEPRKLGGSFIGLGVFIPQLRMRLPPP
jgi:hypothetical protein